MPDNPNATATAAAAAAVDPNSPLQQAMLAKMSTARSYADNLNDATMGRARAMPGLDTDSDFAKGLEAAIMARPPEPGDGSAQGFKDIPGLDQPSQEQPAPVDQPERKLTDPPIRRAATVQKHKFKELKTELAQTREQWQAREQELTRELETLRAAPKPAAVPDPVIADIIAERDTLRQELTAYGAVKNPQLDLKQKVTITQAKNIAGDKGSLVETVLMMPPGALRDAKLDELLGELPVSTAAIVRNANEKLAAIDFDRQIEVETAKASVGERVKFQEQQALAAKANRAREFDNLVNEWKGSVDALDPAKDKGAIARIAQAREWFEGKQMNAKEQAALAVQAALVPALVQESQNLEQEVQRLRSALARYEGSLPNGDTAVEMDGAPSPPRNFEERQSEFERGLAMAQRVRQDPTFAEARRAKMY
jgi:hypothetical protein